MNPTSNPFVEAPPAREQQSFRRFGEGEQGPMPDEGQAVSEAASASGHDPEPGKGLRDVTAEAAHDFNNLLSVILACASELELSLEPDSGREQAEEIRTAAERGARLARRLIDAARADREETDPTDVNGTVIEAARLLDRALGEGIELRTQPAAGLPQVALAGDRIEQMLLNLIANSRDAISGRGRVVVRTRLIQVEPGDERLGVGWHVELSVSDTGAGMSAEVMERALEPYFTTKPDGAGSGLGLPTIAGIARGAGGDLRLASAPGLGTTVSIYLPAIDPDGSPLTLSAASSGD